jgi:N-methylhydantoinase B/oxoprolinase/acetone carboxylase alpha subunit
MSTATISIWQLQFCDDERDEYIVTPEELSGARNIAIARPADVPERTVFKDTEIPLLTGDCVTFLTAGGGGYSDPRRRDPKEIENDVAQGFVSPEQANAHYGWRAIT